MGVWVDVKRNTARIAATTLLASCDAETLGIAAAVATCSAAHLVSSSLWRRPNAFPFRDSVAMHCASARAARLPVDSCPMALLGCGGAVGSVLFFLLGFSCGVAHSPPHAAVLLRSEKKLIACWAYSAWSTA